MKKLKAIRNDFIPRDVRSQIIGIGRELYNRAARQGRLTQHDIGWLFSKLYRDRLIEIGLIPVAGEEDVLVTNYDVSMIWKEGGCSVVEVLTPRIPHYRNGRKKKN